jgi:hypothetical protein
MIEKFGRLSWNLFHYLSIQNNNKNFKNFVINYMYLFICMKCKKHFFENLKEYPIDDFTNSFTWSWYFHNIVNTQLNKPIVNYDDAYNYYIDLEIDDDDLWYLFITICNNIEDKNIKYFINMIKYFILIIPNQYNKKILINSYKKYNPNYYTQNKQGMLQWLSDFINNIYPYNIYNIINKESEICDSTCSI